MESTGGDVGWLWTGDGNSLHVTGRKGRVGTNAGWYVGLAAEQETGSPQLGHVVTDCKMICLCAPRGW